MSLASVTPSTELEKRLDDLSHIAKINDFYLTNAESFAFKLNGKVFYDRLVPSESDIFSLSRHLGATETQGSKERIVEGDYGLSLGAHRYRANLLRTLGRWRFVLRLLPKNIPLPSEIGCPQHVVDMFMAMNHGLVLLTGPTGSGKSTTIASLINYRAQRTQEHVVTLEDPVEYLYPDIGPNIITQREVGQDLESFADGIKRALRQSPNIVMVGEIRDPVTAEAALQLSETGHVVISTLHTNSVDQTVQRFLKLIPADRVEASTSTMADILRMVLCQRLLPTMDGLSRIAVHELMVQTTGIANMIRSGRFEGIKQDIETGSRRGQITWERSIQKHVQDGILDPRWLKDYASIRDELPEEDKSPTIERCYDLPDWAVKLMSQRNGTSWG